MASPGTLRMGCLRAQHQQRSAFKETACEGWQPREEPYVECAARLRGDLEAAVAHKVQHAAALRLDAQRDAQRGAHAPADAAVLHLRLVPAARTDNSSARAHACSLPKDHPMQT